MKKIIALLLFFVMSINANAKETPEELKDLYAQSAVLMDADSGRILFGKNQDQVMPMASTTKIMTCILVLENADLKEVATVSSYAVSQPRVKLNVQEQEQFYIEDLLYSLMLESHNDSAVVLAEHVAGSVEAFAKLMNDKAIEIGCKDTHFITPNGLDAADKYGTHATTASDLAKIMRYCINISEKRELFLQITQTEEYAFQNVSGIRKFDCKNHNAFLAMMDGALSGKTGYTSDAGYCYVGALRKEDETYIVVLLACGWPNHKSYKWSDTKKLMNYGLKYYSYQDVWEKPALKDIVVKNAMTDDWDTVSQLRISIFDEPEKLLWLIKDSEKIEFVVDLPEELEAPIKEGEKIGTVKCLISGVGIGQWNIVSDEKIRKKSWKGYVLKLINEMLNF